MWLEWKSFTNKIAHWTKHSVTTINAEDMCDIILESF